MKRLIAVLYVIFSDNYLLATKAKGTSQWDYVTNCDDSNKLDCAIDLQEKWEDRWEKIQAEDLQAQINVQAAFEIANNPKLDE